MGDDEPMLVSDGWTAILDCIIDQCDPPAGLLEALTEVDPERAARFAQFLIATGCGTVTAVQSEVH